MPASPLPERTDPAVTALLTALRHPRLPEIERLRAVILGASPGVHECVKWNAPSYRTAAGEDFATFHLRGRGGDVLSLVFHTGAKARADAAGQLAVPDPGGLLDWRAKDRAVVTFRDAADTHSKAPALAELVREWVAAR